MSGSALFRSGFSAAFGQGDREHNDRLSQTTGDRRRLQGLELLLLMSGRLKRARAAHVMAECSNRERDPARGTSLGGANRDASQRTIAALWLPQFEGRDGFLSGIAKRSANVHACIDKSLQAARVTRLESYGIA